MCCSFYWYLPTIKSSPTDKVKWLLQVKTNSNTWNCTSISYITLLKLQLILWYRVMFALLKCAFRLLLKNLHKSQVNLFNVLRSWRCIFFGQWVLWCSEIMPLKRIKTFQPFCIFPPNTKTIWLKYSQQEMQSRKTEFFSYLYFSNL